MDSEDAKARSVDGEDARQEEDGSEATGGSLATDVRSVSAAREVDGARAWECSDRLARLAVLATGNPDRAYELTREALLSVGRDGQYVQARRKLLRRAVRIRSDPHTAALLPGLGGLTPAARLWRRLMALPATERALVVLTEAEGMADAVAGAVLGLPRGETETVLQRVRQVLESQAQLTEAERREVFEGPALLPATGAVPAQALSRALRGRRRKRVLSAVLAVLVLVGVLSGALLLTGGDGGGAGPADGLPGRFGGEVAQLADPSRWAARGDLVDDRELLRSAVRVWRQEGLGGDGDRPPSLVWAGRMDGSRRLVVLAGLGRDGDRVLGFLVGDGGGLRLRGTQPLAPALAVAFAGLDEDAPAARRFLVAPWVTDLALNDTGAAQPTGPQEFRRLPLHEGLSDGWDRAPAGGACARPVLRLTGQDPASAGSDVTAYALDADDAALPVSVADPLPGAAEAQVGYLAVLRGAAPCGGGAGGASLALGGTGEPAGTQVSELHLTTVWSGGFPDHRPGQVLRLSWRVSRPDSGVETGVAFAVAHSGAVRYSAPRFALEARDLDTAVGGVVWPQVGRQPGFLVVAGTQGVRQLDLQPRPGGFRPGGPVAFGPAPRRGQRLSVLGVDRFRRVVSVQPLDF